MLTLLLLFLACGDKDADSADPGDTGGEDSGGGDSGDTGSDDSGAPDSGTDSGDTGGDGPDAYADAIVRFEPGDSAGYGQEDLPDVVLGPPSGGGDGAGSLDVLSLGDEGVIVLAFDDIGLVDGDGPDLLVFENPFSTWVETGVVAVSEDGETWHEWACASDDPSGGYPGCAGVNPVYGNPDKGIDPTDPDVAGGDAFDLGDLGIARARFVRIRDSGANDYGGTGGGFDLDAVAVVNGEVLSGR